MRVNSLQSMLPQAQGIAHPAQMSYQQESAEGTHLEKLVMTSSRHHLVVGADGHAVDVLCVGLYQKNEGRKRFSSTLKGDFHSYSSGEQTPREDREPEKQKTAAKVVLTMCVEMHGNSTTVFSCKIADTVLKGARRKETDVLVSSRGWSTSV